MFCCKISRKKATDKKLRIFVCGRSGPVLLSLLVSLVFVLLVLRIFIVASWVAVSKEDLSAATVSGLSDLVGCRAAFLKVFGCVCRKAVHNLLNPVVIFVHDYAAGNPCGNDNEHQEKE